MFPIAFTGIGIVDCCDALIRLDRTRADLIERPVDD